MDSAARRIPLIRTKSVITLMYQCFQFSMFSMYMNEYSYTFIILHKNNSGLIFYIWKIMKEKRFSIISVEMALKWLYKVLIILMTFEL